MESVNRLCISINFDTVLAHKMFISYGKIFKFMLYHRYFLQGLFALLLQCLGLRRLIFVNHYCLSHTHLRSLRSVVLAFHKNVMDNL
ncbi:hypothetical protein RIF29_41989 [Crotalaria pallida]|uniref:Uncharacterized protein n=1 Tax=Crotalaria pallida TaxID=3830 RepID=A0AAN9HT85_CROPI